ncbi:DNA damage-regulated autophagy modulator protein 2-like [Poecilia reticulata]|uniref:DNA damage-regulated autophagy modulator protein 2-like n=1 Tax=Poecilia reticulata TaxID=8081 RepID=UPI0004A2AD4E|nr:PREDICTED: DNA damage-regulated autophagy modulator protein 2-like [Poecilia reticulata]
MWWFQQGLCLLPAALVVWTVALKNFVILNSRSVFVSSVIMYTILSGVDVPRKLHWLPGEPGYVPHMVSTVSEWFLAFSFISFFLTYIRDFQVVVPAVLHHSAEYV